MPIETQLQEPTLPTTSQPLRMRRIREVLEGAKGAGDEMLLAAARRLIRANMPGWKSTHNLRIMSWSSRSPNSGRAGRR